MIEVDCQIFIKKNGVSFLGAAKTELLQEIVQNGSLRRAAKNRNISYQHAWNLIAEMNRIAPQPLVVLQRGGVKGGGTELTVYGRMILDEYRQIEAVLNKMIHQINVEINL